MKDNLEYMAARLRPIKNLREGSAGRAESRQLLKLRSMMRSVNLRTGRQPLILRRKISALTEALKAKTPNEAGG